MNTDSAPPDGNSSPQLSGPRNVPTASAVLEAALPAVSSAGVSASEGSTALCTGRVSVTAQVTSGSQGGDDRERGIEGQGQGGDQHGHPLEAVAEGERVPAAEPVAQAGRERRHHDGRRELDDRDQRGAADPVAVEGPDQQRDPGRPLRHRERQVGQERRRMLGRRTAASVAPSDSFTARRRAVRAVAAA